MLKFRLFEKYLAQIKKAVLKKFFEQPIYFRFINSQTISF